MKLIKVKGWTFVKNGATSYWFEETTDGSGDTIGPEELLEIGCQLEAENEALREYATHKPGCYENGDKCICGLDTLLTGEKK